MLCVKCGKTSDDNLMYCSFCGYKLPDLNPGKPKIDNRPVEEQPVKKAQSGTFAYGNINSPSGGLTGNLPVPNKMNFFNSFSVVYDKKCHVNSEGEMAICLEVDGVKESVPSDIMDCVYGDLSIIKHVDDPSLYSSRYAVWNLNNLRCYELSENGIYYAKGNEIFFLDNSGSVKAIGRCDNIIDMKLLGNALHVRTYKGMRQTASRERRDGLGYVHELCVDVYQVNTEIKLFYI